MRSSINTPLRMNVQWMSLVALCWPYVWSICPAVLLQCWVVVVADHVLLWCNLLTAIKEASCL